MNWHNWFLGLCLFLAVFDVSRLGAGADEICFKEDALEKGIPARRKISPNDPFNNRPVPVPVKVRCEPANPSCLIKKPEPTCEDLRVIKDVKEKQKSRDEARRSAVVAFPSTAEKQRRTAEDVVGPTSGRHSGGAMAAECEQCEIQIKANGDGIFLRCRKCHPTSVEGMRFPNPSPNRVIQLP